MRRKYLNKLDVWLNESISDNFGGNTLSPIQLSSSWCNIRTLPVDKMIDYGLDISQQAITITTRYRSDLNYFQTGLFFKYLGVDWMPSRIYNKDLINEEITIIATGFDGEGIVLPPSETFDETFDNTFL